MVRFFSWIALILAGFKVKRLRKEFRELGCKLTNLTLLMMAAAAITELKTMKETNMNNQDSGKRIRTACKQTRLSSRTCSARAEPDTTSDNSGGTFGAAATR